MFLDDDHDDQGRPTVADPVGRIAGRALPRVELVGAGLPDQFAVLLSNSDAVASRGDLFDDGRQLSRFIGRPTTPLATVVAENLPGQGIRP